MGHWSEEPYDNDGAMDLLPDFHGAVFKAIKQEVDSWDLTDLNCFPYDYVRCTAQYMIDYLNVFSTYDDNAYLVCDKIIKALRIIENSTYCDTWKDVPAFKVSLKSMYDQTKSIEKNMKTTYDLFNGDK